MRMSWIHFYKIIKMYKQYFVKTIDLFGLKKSGENFNVCTSILWKKIVRKVLTFLIMM